MAAPQTAGPSPPRIGGTGAEPPGTKRAAGKVASRQAAQGRETIRKSRTLSIERGRVSLALSTGIDRHEKRAAAVMPKAAQFIGNDSSRAQRLWEARQAESSTGAEIENRRNKEGGHSESKAAQCRSGKTLAAPSF